MPSRFFPATIEEDLLRYAATAFHDLDDERAGALRTACRARGIALLDLQPTEFTTDLTLVQGTIASRSVILDASPWSLSTKSA